MRSPEEIARSYLGTPFAHQGRTPSQSLDCAGLVICTARERGLVPADFDVSNYAQQPDKTSIVDACDQYLIRVPRDQAEPSDVIVIAWDSHPQHLGIMGVYKPLKTERTLIHAFARQGDKKACVTEHRLTPDLMRRIVRVYRFPEVA